VTGSYVLDDWGLITCCSKVFIFTSTFKPALGPSQLFNQSVPGDVFPGERRSERDCDHFPACSAEIKNVWNNNFSPAYVLIMTCCLFKHRNDFTFHKETF